MDKVAAEFGHGKSLYDVLEIFPTANPSEIKKAYFKIALKCHPDKCPGDAAAKGRFQALSLVHSVLSDPERRSLYDETGEVSEDGETTNKDTGDTWFEYWRALFPKITVGDIESFGNKYQGSHEERDDVFDAYKKCRGRMSAVINSIMLATEADENRFREMIELAIKRDDVPAFSVFQKGAKRAGSSKSKGKRKAKEAAEAEELASMLKQRNQERVESDSLSIQRAQQFNNMVSSLEKRYGGEKKSSGRSNRGKRAKDGTKKSAKVLHSDVPDMDDDEFQRIQKKILKNRSKR